MEADVVRWPGRVAWALVAAAALGVALGAAGFWVGRALGAGIGVAAGVVAPLLVESIRRRVEVGEAARRLEPPARRLGPASLLDPALGVVPFTGRTAELAALRRWCGNDDAGPVRLVVGGGGEDPAGVGAEAAVGRGRGLAVRRGRCRDRGQCPWS